MRKSIFYILPVIFLFPGMIYSQINTYAGINALFDSLDAALVLYDLNNDQYFRYNPQRCEERFLPASTFKIFNSLVGLETGAIPNVDYVIPWDSTNRWNENWNRDNSMRTAMKYSVVPYYQELARRVGENEMRKFVDAADYGNKDISGGIDRFWLNGGLRISADEQIEFLKKFYFRRLPFSDSTIDQVKQIIVLDETPVYKLSGKTGTAAKVTDKYLSWYIGYLEESGNVYFYALNFDSDDSNVNLSFRNELIRKIFRQYGLIK